MIKPQPGILDIAPYVGGASKLAGRDDVLKLSSNENPFGTPPAAQEALRRVAGDMHRYPTTDHGALRAAIADLHGLDAERIICGVGSDEIIAFLCQAYAGPGEEVIYTEFGFLMYKISALAAGATPVKVAEVERHVSVENILAAVTERTRLVFIANPANPTGTMISSGEIDRLAQGLSGQALLVLDGAYAEYAQGFDGGAAQVEAHPNVVMTRTFSKLYGLGGLRVGWGYGPADVIDVLNRIRGPFNLSAPALAAAEAALGDREFAERSFSENQTNGAWMMGALRELGLGVDASHANFLLVRFDSEEHALGADASLRDAGIIVRQMGGYGLPNALRITIGDQSACRRVVHAIGTFLGDQNGV